MAPKEEAEMDIDSPSLPPQKGMTDAASKTHDDAVAIRSIEGWILLVTNIHEEASEEDVQDRFADYGEVRNIHLNLDRRSGYVKGYALVEFPTLDEAKAAIKGTHQTKLLDRTIEVDFAFVRPMPSKAPREGGSRRKDMRDRPRDRDRSKSPGEPLDDR